MRAVFRLSLACIFLLFCSSVIGSGIDISSNDLVSSSDGQNAQQLPPGGAGSDDTPQLEPREPEVEPRKKKRKKAQNPIIHLNGTDSKFRCSHCMGVTVRLQELEKDKPPVPYADRSVVFNHIQKTGGMSLRKYWIGDLSIKFCSEDKILDWNSLNRLLRPDRRNNPELKANTRTVAKLIYNNCTKRDTPKGLIPNVIQLGHNRAYALGDWFSKDVHYFTMMRHPVERLVSFYYFIRRNPSQPGYRAIQQQSLSEFIFDQPRNSMINRHLLNVTSSSQVESTMEYKYMAALRNLRRTKVIGIQEYYRETILLLEYTFGWEDLAHKITHENASGTKRAVSVITADFICQLNFYDCIIYEHAVDIFKQQIITMGDCCPEFQERLREINSPLVSLFDHDSTF